MKLVRVTDQEELSENIPLEALQFVDYLNRVLAADPLAVTQLIDHAVPVNTDILEAVFPHLVIREAPEQPVGEPEIARTQDKYPKGHMSGLGLIAGFTNTDKYRIYAEFPNNELPFGNITHFGWFRVEEDLSEVMRRSDEIDHGLCPVPMAEAVERLQSAGPSDP